MTKGDDSLETQFVVGVDTGGTFTDACAVAISDGVINTAKARSTLQDPSLGLMEVIDLLAGEIGLTVEELLARTVKLAHGTTQTTNSIFTWSGARVGLITTRGFGDEILIMRARGRVAGKSLSERRHLRATDKPPRIVNPRLIEEINERVDFRGEVLVGLTEEEAKRAVGSLLEKGAESIAVALLWSPENPSHELLIADVAQRMSRDTYVTLSHQIAPVIGEYERASTSAVDAYVGPTLVTYLRALGRELSRAGLRVPLLILQASGGVLQAEDTLPVNTIESGPAAGMVAVKSLAESAGFENVIATDVGGTTFKVGLIVDGVIPMARETIINQYSLLMPMVDIVSIGAGGGSITWIDGPRLRVGPKSAGSDPGPACYGWGGMEPTVTDADLLLGFLNPETFLGGRQKLSRDLAESVFKDRIAKRLFGGDAIRAAAGTRRIVDAAMADLIRKATIERGYDPRTFVLFAYGGAGPLHAEGYARDIGVNTIVVPPAATVYSAYGAAASDIRYSMQHSVGPGVLNDENRLAERLSNLEREARELLRRQDVQPQDMRLTYWADMRYERQLHDVRVFFDSFPQGGISDTLEDAFVTRYEALYGAGAMLRGAGRRLLRLGIDAIGAITKPPLRIEELRPSDPSNAAAGTRDVFWPDLGGWVATAIFDGPKLVPGNRIVGPAIIDHPGTTIVIPGGGNARLDRFGNTVITLVEA